jgi:hypothetical protein
MWEVWAKRAQVLPAPGGSQVGESKDANKTSTKADAGKKARNKKKGGQ